MEIYEASGASFEIHYGMVLFSPHEALKFLDHCETAGLRLLGAEGFRLVTDGIEPDMSAILDLSSVKDPASSVREARRYLQTVSTPDILFEFVLDDSAWPPA